MIEFILKVDLHKESQEQDQKKNVNKMKKKIVNQKIASPCISICKTDPRTGYCYGCARTNEEKMIWKTVDTKTSWKKKNLNLLTERMSGWQLETFKESYATKVTTGFSIYRQNLMKNSNEK